MSHGIYMDVHVPAAVTEGLRRRGVDVRTTQEDGMERAVDEDLLQRATELRRMLFTQDEDFLAIAARWQTAARAFMCVVYAHQLGPGVGEMIEELELLATCAEAEELQNRVIHLPLR
jgi:hypothetical protein